ncbi:MAG TPA: hypothetical protein VHO00_00055 [Actinomycetes bacterium]|nr:hypothetical protein [Actinomycetes bacterium]
MSGELGSVVPVDEQWLVHPGADPFPHFVVATLTSLARVLVP